MPEAFRVVEKAPGVLTLKLGQHGLDGEAPELFDFVTSAIAAGHHTVTLDAADAAIVTLEGVGVLVRLLGQSRTAGGGLRIVSVHPTLERKLRQTGLLSRFQV
jgi:anti-anti-sigma factor